MICKKCRVNGRVQGVFYRATTQDKARSLGLTGYVRNLSDGSVEVLVCGASTKVDQLCNWLWEGPATAEISDVQCEVVEFTSLSVFEIH